MERAMHRERPSGAPTLHAHVGRRSPAGVGRARRLRRRARRRGRPRHARADRARGPASACSSSPAAPAASGLAAAERVAPGGEVVLSDVVAEMTAIAAARAAALGLTQREHARARPRGDRRARRAYDVVLCREGLMFAADPAGPRARSRACCARAAASRSRSGARASATRGSASSSTPSAPRSARRCRRPASPARSRSTTPTGSRRCSRDAGLARRRRRASSPVPLRAASFDEWWARTSALAGPLAQRARRRCPTPARDALRDRRARGGRAVRDRRRARVPRRQPDRVRAR